jgi:hypothetical protein
MEYYNIIILVLIFVIVIISFYLIISNFGINSSSNITGEFNNSVNLENKINVLKYELSSIKNKIANSENNSSNTQNLSDRQISVPISNEKNSIKEIIIEQDISTPNIQSSTNDNMSQCVGSNCNKQPPIIYDPIANYDIAKLTDPLVDPRGRSSADQIPTPQVAMQLNFPTQGVLDRYHRVGLLISIESNRKKDKINKVEMPYSMSDKSNYSDSDSDYDSDPDSNSDSNFVWNGPSKTSINKKKKRFVNVESDNSSTKSYKGVDIKENFDSDSIEYFANTDNTITNVYNTYSNNNDNSILELIGKKITDNWYKYFTSITMGNKIIKVVVHNKNRKELYSGDIIYIPEIKKSFRVKIDPMDMIEYNPYFF